MLGVTYVLKMTYHKLQHFCTAAFVGHQWCGLKRGDLSVSDPRFKRGLKIVVQKLKVCTSAGMGDAAAKLRQQGGRGSKHSER